MWIYLLWTVKRFKYKYDVVIDGACDISITIWHSSCPFWRQLQNGYSVVQQMNETDNIINDTDLNLNHES